MKSVLIGLRVGPSDLDLQPTLDSLARHPGPIPSRIIQLRSVPDNGPSAFNALAHSEDTDLYVLLESGCIVTKGWLDRIVAALRERPDNGLAGPSTNLCWNEQQALAPAANTCEAIENVASSIATRFSSTTRTLEPLYSLNDFCYAVRREVIRDIGLADESYGHGPCWEMDYNIRAARAGWRGIWVCGAYVHRAVLSEKRPALTAALFDASKRRYQDKFCGARLRGLKTDYRPHCRGNACPNFAPPELLSNSSAPLRPQSPALVSCIMPTCDRPHLVCAAIQCFLQQDYPALELIIVDDGNTPIENLLPTDPRIRYLRLSDKKLIGAKRNIACGAARGEIIVHFDDDDWYPPHRVTAQVAAFNASAIVISGSSSVYYHQPEANRAWLYHWRGDRNWVTGNTLAYRKSWWAAHPFPEIQVGEDSRFIWTAPSAAIADLCNPHLCVARIHSLNACAKTTNNEFWQPIAIAVLPSPWQSPLPPLAPMASCIMPTFNRRPFVSLAIQSFLAQDYPHKELIIIDDGSDSVADLASNLPNIRHRRLPGRESIGEKRNIACSDALGAIIVHWDDDDWYGPERLTRQIQPLLDGVADVTGLENAFQLELSVGQFWRVLPHLHRHLFTGDVHGGTLVYWKKFFDEGSRFPGINLAEDAMFIQSLTKRGKRLARIDNTGFFIYMRHGHNSWQFKSGSFLDPTGWQQTVGPSSFSEDLLQRYRHAAADQARL